MSVHQGVETKLSFSSPIVKFFARPEEEWYVVIDGRRLVSRYRDQHHKQNLELNSKRAKMCLLRSQEVAATHIICLYCVETRLRRSNQPLVADDALGKLPVANISKQS